MLQRSFDTDEVTQQQLDFLVRYCSLFESILSRLFAPETTYLNAASRITTLSINLPMEQLLIWGTAATNQYIHAVTGPLTQRVTIWRNVSFFDKLFSVKLNCFRTSSVFQRCSIIWQDFQFTFRELSSSKFVAQRFE